MCFSKHSNTFDNDFNIFHSLKKVLKNSCQTWQLLAWQMSEILASSHLADVKAFCSIAADILVFEFSSEICLPLPGFYLFLYFSRGPFADFWSHRRQKASVTGRGGGGSCTVWREGGRLLAVFAYHMETLGKAKCRWRIKSEDNEGRVEIRRRWLPANTHTQR